MFELHGLVTFLQPEVLDSGFSGEALAATVITCLGWVHWSGPRVPTGYSGGIYSPGPPEVRTDYRRVIEEKLGWTPANSF